MPATYATNSNNSSKATITKQRQGGHDRRKEPEEGQKGVEVASVLCVREAPPEGPLSLGQSLCRSINNFSAAVRLSLATQGMQIQGLWLKMP
ncbi:hypothetical protein CDAR_440781 [Caerostris darwini]|uniref:Uncharacterized protein n=1 Tax=Caerostris darwini TaxID=1538125 RepID=A0AAV4MMF5_9ARAC|nr:hypothetical protein CDAR_440781 [Caerostris darwini]